MQYVSPWVVVAAAAIIGPALVACNPDPGQGAGVDTGGGRPGSMDPVDAQDDVAEDADGADAPAADEAGARPGPTSTDAGVEASTGVTKPSRDAATTGDGARGATTFLTELDASELASLCKWTDGLRTTPTERQLCISKSLQARSRAACLTQVQSCLSAHSTVAPPKAQCNESFIQMLPERCAKVEIDDYRSCAQAAAEVANQRLSSLSCDLVDMPDPGTPQGVIPACAELVRICPELAPDDSGAASPWTGGSFVCQDGWPLFSDEVCNGKADCLGGEDETSC